MIKKKEFFSGLLFIISDIVCVLTSFYLSYFIRFKTGLPAPKGVPPISQYVFFSVLFVVLHLLIFSLKRRYRSQLIWRRSDETVTIFMVTILTVLLSLAVVGYLRSYGWINFEISHLFLVVYAFINPVLCIMGRGAVRYYIEKRWKDEQFKTKAVIVGAGTTAEILADSLKRFSPLGYELLGSFSEKEIPGVKLLGKEEDVVEFVKDNRVDEVYIIHPLKIDTRNLINQLTEYVIEIKMVPDLLGYVVLKPSLEQINGVAAINITHVPLQGWGYVLKRLFDIVVSFIALVVFAPIMGIIALAIKLYDGGPVIYAQERVGIDGKKFTMYKFRTMRVDAEKNGPQWPKPDDPRVTKIGRFLRKYSLDELPQLFNVLKGDMSLVGPRPERPYFVNEFRKRYPRYMLRHKVKSGMTGWAQVHGLRGDTSLEKRLEYDLYYIENWSFWLDIKILIMTLWRFKDPNLRL